MKGKKWIRRLCIITLCVAAGLAAVYMGILYGLKATVKSTDEAWRQIGPVDLNQIADGVYRGRAGGFLCSADLNVTVKDHRIADVAINSQINGGGKYAAPGIMGRIVDAQSPNVDAVTGATLTSKTAMVAVYRALAESPLSPVRGDIPPH